MFVPKAGNGIQIQNNSEKRTPLLGTRKRKGDNAQVVLNRPVKPLPQQRGFPCAKLEDSAKRGFDSKRVLNNERCKLVRR